MFLSGWTSAGQNSWRLRRHGKETFCGGNALLEQAVQVMQEHLKIVPAPQVELSPLGYDTALFGAIATAIHGLED